MPVYHIQAWGWRLSDAAFRTSNKRRSIPNGVSLVVVYQRTGTATISLLSFRARACETTAVKALRMLNRAVLLFFSANRPSSELGPCEATFHPRGHTIRAEELTCGRAARNRRATDAVNHSFVVRRRW